MGRGDLSYRLDIITGDEIEQLADAFNQMTLRLGNMVGDLEIHTADLEQRSAYLAASAEVGRAAASILESETLIRQVVDLIKDRFNLYYVGLFLVEADADAGGEIPGFPEKTGNRAGTGGKWAVLQAGTGVAGQEMLARGHRLAIGVDSTSMIGRCVATAKADIQLDVGEASVCFNNPLLPDTRSEGALPLRSRGRVLGALTVQSSAAAAFDQDTVSVLQVMADQVAVALDDAELFAQSQAALEAERRAYGEISREAWSEVLHARSGLGYRADERGVTSLGDERAEAEFCAASELPELVLPVRVRGNAIGTVVAHKPGASGAWTTEERALVQTLIDNLDMALDGARMYQDSQRRAIREQMTREITDALQRAVSMESLMHIVTEELNQSLGGARTYVRFDAERLNAISGEEI